MKEKSDELHRPIQLGVPLIALAVMGSMALAQEQGQQAPRRITVPITARRVRQNSAMAGGSMREA